MTHAILLLTRIKSLAAIKHLTKAQISAPINDSFKCKSAQFNNPDFHSGIGSKLKINAIQETQLYPSGRVVVIVHERVDCNVFAN